MRVLIETTSADGDSILTPLDGDDAVWAVRAYGNPLDEAWSIPSVESDRIVCWSGTLADDLFESHPMTWLAAGHEALKRFCDAAEPQLCAQSRRLCFQPHARHVLSDPPSIFTFLQNREDQPFDVLLSPAEMCEPSMLDTIEDHLVRMFETLGDLAVALVLHDVAVDEAGESCKPVLLGDGLLPRSLVRTLIADNCPAEIPLILSPEQIDRQIEWLS